MSELSKNTSLPEYQEYIQRICKERGWDKNNHLEIFLLFSEEIGELAKAIRNHIDLYQENGNAKRDKFELEEEFADVFSYLLDLANYFEVDLATAFKKKEELNAKRSWKG